MVDRKMPKTRVNVAFNITATQTNVEIIEINPAFIKTRERIVTTIIPGTLTADEGTPESEIVKSLMKQLFPDDGWVVASCTLIYG